MIGGLDLQGVPVERLIAALLCVAAIVAVVRLVLREWRGDPLQRARPWRTAVLVAAQPVCAALLYLTLVPPLVEREAGTLIVLTAGAPAPPFGEPQSGSTVALPEAPVHAGVQREPDLATALRRRPGTRRIEVVGHGLEARDLDAARGLAIGFDAAALPRGLVELEPPTDVAPGAAFEVAGRVHDVPGGFAELFDPATRRVDRVALDAHGRFEMSGTARVEGVAEFSVRIRDARERIVEDVTLPVVVSGHAPARVLVLAGAPGPELKFLRRWAQDAGLPMHTRIAAGGDMVLGDAPLAINAATLARFDLVLLDERSLAGLGGAQQAALLDAVRGGLGVLVRVSAALGDGDRQRLRALGWAVDRGAETAAFRLPGATRGAEAERARIGPGSPDAPVTGGVVDEVPVLSRRALRVAGDPAALLRDASGVAVAAWRAEGRGRVAVWTPTDTYRLVLAGRRDLHAELWSHAVAVLSRAQPRPAIRVVGEAREGERLALCGLTGQAQVTSPTGEVVEALIDPITGARRCAAVWPRSGGWHRVHGGESAAVFRVRGADEARGLRLHALQAATHRLASEPVRGSAPAASVDGAPSTSPASRWPWFLAWLLASAALWWFERSRLGAAGRTGGESAGTRAGSSPA